MALKYGWAVATLWSSEEPSADAVRQAVLSSIYRCAYFSRHGPAGSLEQMLGSGGLGDALRQDRPARA
jgi:hypothetical protein